MDLVTIASYTSQPEASLAKNLLESEGIKAFLSEEYAGEMLHLDNEIKLTVPSDRVEEAREILASAEQHELTEDAASEAEEHAEDEAE
jgi:Putative prokaryotic signal transducing protein